MILIQHAADMSVMQTSEYKITNTNYWNMGAYCVNDFVNSKGQCLWENRIIFPLLI